MQTDIRIAELAQDVIAYGDDHGAQTRLHQAMPQLGGLWIALDILNTIDDDLYRASVTTEEWLANVLSVPASAQTQAVEHRYHQMVKELAAS